MAHIPENLHILLHRRQAFPVLGHLSGKLRPFLVQFLGAVLGSLQMHLEIADSGIVGVQLVPVGSSKLFLWFLKPDGGIFRMNRLVGFKVSDMGKHGVNLLHTLFLRLHLCPDGNGLLTDGIQIGVKALHGGQLLFPQIADGVHNLVEVVHSAFELAFARPAGALLPAQIQIFAQQLR